MALAYRQIQPVIDHLVAAIIRIATHRVLRQCPGGDGHRLLVADANPARLATDIMSDQRKAVFIGPNNAVVNEAVMPEIDYAANMGIAHGCRPFAHLQPDIDMQVI